ncbi:MAG: hypothetical protein AAGJ94_09865 [Pseudomonadota bacterium]
MMLNHLLLGKSLLVRPLDKPSRHSRRRSDHAPAAHRGHDGGLVRQFKAWLGH